MLMGVLIVHRIARIIETISRSYKIINGNTTGNYDTLWQINSSLNHSVLLFLMKCVLCVMYAEQDRRLKSEAQWCVLLTRGETYMQFALAS